MREIFKASLAALTEPIRGLRVLLFGFSGPGFPGGNGRIEAVDWLPQAGLEVTYSNELDPELEEKLSRHYDVSVICNTRAGAVLGYDRRVWTSATESVWWFWDLRNGEVGAPLRGRPRHVFLSYNGRWTSPSGTVYEPRQWAHALGAAVHYCPQGAPLREPVTVPDAPRVLFVGDLANSTYHRGRREMCSALGAKVLNARDRNARLAIEAQMPGLYSSSRYCLSMSPLAPGYTSVRSYSILACGGLMLLHRFPGADEIFSDGENVILFDTAEEAIARAAGLDADPEERVRIAAAGRLLHATRHTVAHRIISICREVTGC
jgi:hypothetical protein